VLLSKKVRRQIESYATGTSQGMKNISQDEIRSVRVPNPTIEIQKSARVKVGQILCTLNSIGDEIASTRALQKSLINQIF
jgi:type I restriction enzyme S subunit